MNESAEAVKPSDEGVKNPARRSFLKKGVALGLGLAMIGIPIPSAEANTPTPDKPKATPTVDPLTASRVELTNARATVQALGGKDYVGADKIDAPQVISAMTDSAKVTEIADNRRLIALAKEQASGKATATREAGIKAVIASNESAKANISLTPTVTPIPAENSQAVPSKDAGWSLWDIPKVIGGGLVAWSGFKFLKGIGRRGGNGGHPNNDNVPENDAGEIGVNDGNTIDGEFIELDPDPPAAPGPGGTT